MIEEDVEMPAWMISLHLLDRLELRLDTLGAAEDVPRDTTRVLVSFRAQTTPPLCFANVASPCLFVWSLWFNLLSLAYLIFAALALKSVMAEKTRYNVSCGSQTNQRGRELALPCMLVTVGLPVSRSPLLGFLSAANDGLFFHTLYIVGCFPAHTDWLILNMRVDEYI